LYIMILTDIRPPKDTAWESNRENELNFLIDRVAVELLDITAIIQKLTLNTLLMIPKRDLTHLENIMVWQAEDGKAPPGTSSHLELPIFSLSPSSFITRIGEYLLTLPQQLEPYQNDEAFKFSLSTLPHVNLVTEDAEETSATKQWLQSLCSTLLSIYNESILRIPHLSLKGHRQLLTDMQYIENIISALDITLAPEYILLQSLLSLPQEEIKQRLQSTMTSNQTAIHLRVLDMLSKL
jgi:hypothetical protein